MRRRFVRRGLAAAILVVALAACGTAEPPGLVPIVTDRVGDPLVIAAPLKLFPEVPTVGEPVTFDASEVTCSEEPCSFVWEDSNGGPWLLGEGEVLTVTFLGAGVKNVRLTVTDADGRESSLRADIQVVVGGTAPDLDSVTVPRVVTPDPAPSCRPTPWPTRAAPPATTRTTDESCRARRDARPSGSTAADTR